MSADYTITEKTTIEVPLNLARLFVAAVIVGAFAAGMTYFKLDSIAKLAPKVEQHDKDITIIKTKMGITAGTGSNVVMQSASIGDL